MMLFSKYTALLIFLVLIIHHHQAGCYARQTKTNNNQDCVSSCGNIHNISYPFRLNTDPINCGNKILEPLVCENNLTLVVYLESAKYYVESIDYNNFTIQVIDPDFQKDNCSSFPNYPIYVMERGYSYYNYPFFHNPAYLDGSIVLVNCKDRILNSAVYLDTYPCIDSTNNSGYWYVTCGSIYVTDLADSCRIEKQTRASVIMLQEVVKNISYFSSWDSGFTLEGWMKNISYMDFHRILAYGIQLSWSRACCDDNHEENNPCNLDPALLAHCSFYLDDSSMLQYEVNDLLYDLRHFRSVRRIRPMYGEAQGIFYYLSRLNIPRGRLMHYAPYYLLGSLPYLITVLVLFRATLVFCGAICFISFLIYKWQRRHLSIYDNIEEFLQNYDNLFPIRYSYSDIKKITKGFNEKLGDGGYGCVYKGKLRSGNFAAVKILSKSKSNGQDFINEVATIGRIHHANVVRLVGFCAERLKRALVYEFMPNGSLDKYIFSQDRSNQISIKDMYEISLGVARGIDYLHKGCDMQILHFDIKPHNILLDEKFNPKISDFGLAKLYSTDNSIVSLTAARGTLGYMAPELVYKTIGGISYKADVYSFGTLLMEMVGRRKNLNVFAEHSSQIYFPSWVYEQFNKGKDIELGDVSDEEREIAKKMVLVALWCIQLEHIKRPFMHKVIEMLEGEFESLEMPPKPSLLPQDKTKENVAINITLTRPTNTTGDSIHYDE